MKELINSLNILIDYNFKDELKDYEESFDVEIVEDDYNNPERLEHKGHIFYHILVLQKVLNQLEL